MPAVDTIRNADKFRQILPFAAQANCLPRGCYPTDIDGEVEINRHHLFQEWKEVGKKVEEAQMQACRSRLRHMRRFATAWIIWHEPPTENRVDLSDIREMRISQWDVKYGQLVETHAFALDGAMFCDWLTIWGQYALGLNSRYIGAFRIAAGLEHSSIF